MITLSKGITWFFHRKTTNNASYFTLYTSEKIIWYIITVLDSFSELLVRFFDRQMLEVAHLKNHLVRWLLFCFFIYLLILSNVEGLSNRVHLMKRSRRSLNNGVVSTENLKGRPGQGYYIAIEFGTPPQRVSKRYYIIDFSFFFLWQRNWFNVWTSK